MARPTKQTKEIVAKAREYILNYESYGDAIPSHAGMASALSVGKTTLYRWAEDKEGEFRDILEDCNREQEKVLLNKGLTGDFNAAITKLALGKQGYSDKQDLNAEGSLTINVNR